MSDFEDKRVAFLLTELWVGKQPGPVPDEEIKKVFLKMFEAVTKKESVGLKVDGSAE